ncbi:hypothetical protein [Nitrosomonas sp. Nm34]|uniref:hypothetical protein n=1 Tax=Nitrosomonas sp. Nm34 TaxID=1881055 RepID=UPI0008E83730|nr:hypothetical protein [Nitrosomonas sp. Nm34]SFI74544.1 hypothetical protein SAMN05428978_10325 [Nitrosomonas sp. Nm34]
MAWYRREDYDAILRIMTDNQNLPESFDAWFAYAEQCEKKLKRAKDILLCVPSLTPERFPSSAGRMA